MLPYEIQDFIPILAIVFGSLIAMTAIAFGSLKSMSRRKEREQSRRELAAYVAEGSMTAEDAERLLTAGEPKPFAGCEPASA